MKLHLGGSTPHYKPSSIHLQDSKCRSHRVNPTNIQKGAVYTVSDDTDHLDKVNMNNLLKSFVESTQRFSLATHVCWSLVCPSRQKKLVAMPPGCSAQRAYIRKTVSRAKSQLWMDHGSSLPCCPWTKQWKSQKKQDTHHMNHNQCQVHQAILAKPSMFHQLGQVPLYKLNLA